MKLKALQEKRNELLNKADEMLKVVETEVRAMSTEERTEFDAMSKEINEINETIKSVEARRLDGEKIEDKEEKRDMELTTQEKEIRGLDQFLRKQDGEEKRALNVSAQGAALIPDNVEGTIVLKMEETAPVFARARKFASVNGSLKIAKENDTTVAGFVGEGVNVAEGGIAFDEVKLTQKRVGAAISLSNQLLNDSAVNLVDYSVSLLARRAGKAVEKSILIGAGGDEFAGLINDAGVGTVAVVGTVTIENLLDLYNKVHPEFLDGSGFIMQRAFFNTVAKMKDGNGHFYMQNGVVNGKLSYTLFGAEVTVTDALPAGTPVIFGNVQEAYAVMIKKGFTLQHVVGDTTQALRGSQLLVLDGYMDGAVYNPQAVAKMTVA